MAKFLHVSAGGHARDPTPGAAASARGERLRRLSRRRRNLTVKCHRRLQSDERGAMTNVFGESDIDATGFVFQQAGGDLYAGSAEAGKTLSCNFRVRVFYGGDDTADASSNQSVSTWRGAAFVAAWLEIDVQGCATRIGF